MEKVMLSKQEAEALEAALELNGGDRSGVSQYHGVKGLWEGNRKPLNDLDLETINCALYVGYEVEESPEEKVKEYYDYLLVPDNKMIVKATLTLLNIYIKGINC